MLIELLYVNNKSEISKELFNNILILLPENEQIKILKYKLWRDRQARTLGRFLIMDLLKNKNVFDKNISDLSYNNYGKPFFEGINFYFNISHSGDYVVCAFCASESVGVDIEEMKEVNFEDFDSILTIEEKRYIYLSKNKKELFYNIWCAKEAALKADGRGLSIPLNEIDLNHGKVFVKGNIYYTKKIEINKEYEFIVACSNEINEVVVNEFDLEKYLA